MCGILGMYRSGNERMHVNFEEALATLAARGPDDVGTFEHDNVTLGHRRLSILDLSSAGHQPMSDASGRYTIVYNGETYNFPELKEALATQGHRFYSRSDTEVVLAAYIQWGVHAFLRLNGIFALAIYDRHERSLTLARDRLGVKPLYWHLSSEGHFTFASEIKAILRLLDVSRQIDAQALHEFMYFGVPHGARTMFSSIRRLEPGHWMRLQGGQTTCEHYWSVEDIPVCIDDADTAGERSVALLRQAVRRQLVSDVPLACFLSGGIDSTAVATFAVEGGAKLDGYTATFDYQLGTDEVSLARATAQRLGMPHHVLPIVANDVQATVEELISVHSEPFGDAANIPLLMLCRALKGRTKVVLQGDGGDELFAGYRHHGVLAHLSTWRLLSKLRPLTRTLASTSSLARRLDRILDAVSADDFAVVMALLLTTERASDPPENILSSSWREKLADTDPFSRYRAMSARFIAGDPVQRMLRTEASVILPDVYLEKVDRSTMACGIEARVPFLDNDLVQYALSLPAKVTMPRGRPKGLLRSALAPYIDPAILRAPKSGFGVPFSQWMRHGPLSVYAEERLTDASTLRRGIFDPASVTKMLALHRSGTVDRGYLLWKSMNLAIWADKYNVTL